MRTKFLSILAVFAMVIACDNISPDNGDNTGNDNTENNAGDNNGDNNAGDNNTGDNNTDDNNQDTPSGTLSPEENRAKLEQIGQEAITLLNPDRQEDLIEVIDAFYRFVASLQFENGKTAVKAAGTFLDPLKAICNNRVKSVMEYASVHNTYVYGLENVFGIYTYDGISEWSFEESDKKLEFVFTFEGEKTVITIEPSGQTYSYTYTDEGLSEEWNDATQEYEWVEYTDEITVNVPGKIKGTVAQGSRVLADLNIEGEYLVQNSVQLVSEVDLIMSSYDIHLMTNINRASISSEILFKVDGKTLLNFNSGLNGDFDLRPDNYLDNGLNVESVLGFNTLQGMQTKAGILDFNLTSRLNNLQNMEDDIFKFIDLVEKNESETEKEVGTPYSLTKEYVDKVCTMLNDIMANEASYGDDPAFAKVKFKAQYDDNLYYYDEFFDYMDWDEDGRYDDMNGDGRLTEEDKYPQGEDTYKEGYYLMPIIVFEDDGASFSVEEFFNDNDFQNVIGDLEDLIELYMNCFPNIIG